MAIWSCPHCGVSQEETARCWVCRRSSVCCATCQHVRWAVAGGLAYCGLDRDRQPLRGDETRPCWEARTSTDSNDRSNDVPVTAAARRDFVPLELPGARAVDPPTARQIAPAVGRWTLFAESELEENGLPIS